MPPRLPNAVILDRRVLLRGVGALGLASAFGGPGWAASFPGAAAVQATIDQKVAAKQFPGAVVALGTGTAPAQFLKGGTLELEGGATVDENSLWRLASLTKPIAGMATMLLIGEGKLKIDQPVADFIPAFANMRVMPDPKSPETRPAARQITVRHLVTHTSGMVTSATGSLGDALRQLGFGGGPGQAAAPPADALPPPQSLSELVERMAMAPLAVDPGTKWIYGSSLEVAARIIEIVSGMPFDLFLEGRMFAPLGMRSTYFQVPELDKGRLVTSYAQRDGSLVAGDRGAASRLLKKPLIPRASGGLVSSARDYDRFMAMIMGEGTLDGTTVMPAEAVRLGLSNLLPPGTDMSEYSSPTGHDGYGAGGLVTTGGRRPGTYGWGGASGTTAFLNPQFKTRCSTYTNIGTSDFGRQVMAATGTAVA